MTVEEIKTIPAQSVFDEWRKDPKFQREYDALEDEFVLAQLFIKVRGTSGLNQS